jgi:hypothetical protein
VPPGQFRDDTVPFGAFRFRQALGKPAQVLTKAQQGTI